MNPGFYNFDFFAPGPGREILSRLRGKGKRGLLVVYQAGDQEEVPPDYLRRILSAVRLDLEEDAYLLALRPGEPFRFAVLKNALPLRYYLSFGIPAEAAGIHLKTSFYQPLNFAGVQFLLADSLELIQSERQAGDHRRASLLWKALKELFPVEE